MIKPLFACASTLLVSFSLVCQVATVQARPTRRVKPATPLTLPAQPPTPGAESIGTLDVSPDVKANLETSTAPTVKLDDLQIGDDQSGLLEQLFSDQPQRVIYTPSQPALQFEQPRNRGAGFLRFRV
jgi:cell division protein FtsN